MAAEIINICNHTIKTTDLRNQVLNGLSRPLGKRELPSMLLYDERGLKLYEELTTNAREYYLFAAEEDILTRNADNIVKLMQPNMGASGHVSVLELGAGSLHKTSHLLRALSRLVPTASAHAPITYYALDLDENELTRTLGEIQTMSEGAIGKELLGKVETKGLCGTFSDGIEFVQNGGLASLGDNLDGRLRTHDRITDDQTMAQTPPSPHSSAGSSVSEDDNGGHGVDTNTASTTPEPSHSPLHILFLGSTIGNFDRDDAASFIRSLPLCPASGDTLLLGLDHDNEKEFIEEAYNDQKGYGTRFVMNGLRTAGRALGAEDMFKEEQWDYVNYYDTAERRHNTLFNSKRQQVIVDLSSGRKFVFHENEKLKISQSHKFSDEDAYSLFSDGNVRPVHRWTDTNSRYSLWLLERPAFM